jgi:hypothetical protein
MTNHHNAGFIRTTLCAVALAALAACSHSSPSESDAKKVLTNVIGDCKYFKVDDFTKVNGIPIDDNDYRVDVKYTVTMSPNDSDLQDHLEQWVKLSKRYVDVQQDMQQRMNAQDATFRAAVNAANAASEANPNAPQFDQDQFNAAHPSDPVIAQDRAKLEDLTGQMNATGGIHLYEQKIASDCSNLPFSFINSFFMHNLPAETYADKVTLTFNETYPMVKSDNGWMLDR